MGQGRKQKIFHIVYKHHSMLHLLYNSQYLNIKAHWCFSNEDFVGKVSLPTCSSSSGVRSTRLSAKMAPKYKILLSLLLTRDNFKETEGDSDLAKGKPLKKATFEKGHL